MLKRARYDKEPSGSLGHMNKLLQQDKSKKGETCYKTGLVVNLEDLAYCSDMLLVPSENNRNFVLKDNPKPLIRDIPLPRHDIPKGEVEDIAHVFYKTGDIKVTDTGFELSVRGMWSDEASYLTRRYTGHMHIKNGLIVLHLEKNL